MDSAETLKKARWVKDLCRFLPLKSQFILSGNVRDLQVHELPGGGVAAFPLQLALNAELRAAGYADILYYEPSKGFSLLNAIDGSVRSGDDPLQRLEVTGSQTTGAAGLESLTTTIERFVNLEGPPLALIVNFASRLLIRSDAPTPAEHQLFSRAMILSQGAQPRPFGPKRQPFFNTILWVVDKEGDLPDWFVINNPRVRHIPIAKPDRPARHALGHSLLRSLSGGSEASSEQLDSARDAFVDETEGLLLVDLNAIAQLGRSEGLAFKDISDAVRRYKVGVTEDPWQKIEHTKIRNAAEFILKRVKGQDHAVTHVLDIVKRAVTGVGRSPRGGRPRGVAFLAGPTGVGKTELAKTITSLLFGDESAYIRFDMSEFSAEHADQRLIGAPPGYVGYDVGGELTNAIREKPFSVVLFDEIEKAHPRILDKFLQILDDGVLTSGRGDRVYFSEALIIFTSNLGIFSVNQAGDRVQNVSAEDPIDVVDAKVRTEIEKHFKLVLNRPELLNRIGKNIVVFDFIRSPIAEKIFDGMLENLLRDISQLGFEISADSPAWSSLRKLCLADLSNGGRGIRNQVEAHIVNPLSRALFDSSARAGDKFTVSSVSTGPLTTITLKKL